MEVRGSGGVGKWRCGEVEGRDTDQKSGESRVRRYRQVMSVEGSVEGNVEGSVVVCSLL